MNYFRKSRWMGATSCAGKDMGAGVAARAWALLPALLLALRRGAGWLAAADVAEADEVADVPDVVADAGAGAAPPAALPALCGGAG
ncbi:hypothetical protein, partial [Pseudoduganella aquatica]